MSALEEIAIVYRVHVYREVQTVANASAYSYQDGTSPVYVHVYYSSVRHAQVSVYTHILEFVLDWKYILVPERRAGFSRQIVPPPVTKRTSVVLLGGTNKQGSRKPFVIVGK